ncbi:MAG: hypothetical protein ACRYG6_13165 [Janthinobacterium lividum]
MRQTAVRPAWMIAAALLAAGQAPAAARAAMAGPQASVPALSCARDGCGPTFRLAAAPVDEAPDPATPPPPATPDASGDAARQTPDSQDDAGATQAPPANAGPADPEAAPASPSAVPRPFARRRADGAAPIGHFRVYEHPPCSADPCQATVGDLDSHRSFEAAVLLGPMHLAPQLEESARSGQIDLLLSGELHRGPRGPTLRALHLEGVTPHAPVLPARPRTGPARPAPGAARRHPPATPGPGLLRA